LKNNNDDAFVEITDLIKIKIEVDKQEQFIEVYEMIEK